MGVSLRGRGGGLLSTGGLPRLAVIGGSRSLGAGVLEGEEARDEDEEEENKVGDGDRDEEFEVRFCFISV